MVTVSHFHDFNGASHFRLLFDISKQNDVVIQEGETADHLDSASAVFPQPDGPSTMVDPPPGSPPCVIRSKPGTPIEILPSGSPASTTSPSMLSARAKKLIPCHRFSKCGGPSDVEIRAAF